MKKCQKLLGQKKDNLGRGEKKINNMVISLTIVILFATKAAL